MIIKSSRLGVLRRVSSDASGHHLWVTALGAFNLHDAGNFLTEAELWQTATPALGASVLDAGMPKPRAEVLVAGDVCAPQGRRAASRIVSLELGPIVKHLAVFGRRWWRYGPDGPSMTSPEPFERIPLDWSNAFGGPGNPENSLGKGSNARDLLGRREPAELPNIEAPELLVTGIEDRPAPAGLVPRAADAPSRLRFAGVYDDDWLRDGFPGPGRGFDWRYHNTACPDQQTEAELHGNESFRITSMHPKHIELRGRLPGFTVRAFAHRGQEFRELAMRCDTVWLFPNASMGIVLFRGGLAVADKDASDVPHVLLAYERMGDARRTLEHYRTALDERIDPELATLKFFDERPIKPERLPGDLGAVESERQALAHARKQRQEHAHEHAMASAFNTAGLPVPPPELFRADTPMPVELPILTRGEIERFEADIAGLKASADALANHVSRESEVMWNEAERELARALPRALEAIDPRMRPPINDRLAQVTGRLGDLFDLPAARLLPDVEEGSSDPDPWPDDIFDRAEDAPARGSSPAAAQSETIESDSLRRARNRALGTSDEDDPLAVARASIDAQTEGAALGRVAEAAAAESIFDVALRVLEQSHSRAASDASAGRQKLRSVVADPRVDYCDDVARRLSAARSSGDPNEELNRALDDAGIRIGEASTQLDDFRADGRRMSPVPTALEEPLSETDAASLGALALELACAREGLRGRDLAGADLRGADLAGMDLTGIFLEQAKLGGASLAGATLTSAVLTGADLTGTDLTGADLTHSNLSAACLVRARLCDARLDHARIVRSRFDGADMSGVSLAEVSLIETSMTGARLAGAVIRDTQFAKCDLSAISLDGASLNTVVFVESSTEGFSAPAARFERCVLIGLRGEDADLTDAKFIRCACIGGAKLVGARMSGLVSSGSGWRGADLSRADLTAARLDESDLGETNLTGACLHRASLKRSILHKSDATQANFFGATLHEAQAQDANFTRASFHMANLYSADLTDARMTLCDLTGANSSLTLLSKPANAG